MTDRLPITLDTPASGSRRVWLPRTGGDGSMHLSLKAFGVLYDAGRPLSLTELVDTLMPRLDAAEIAYCEAWCLRRRDGALKAEAKRRPPSMLPETSMLARYTPPHGSEALRRWLKAMFCSRATRGQTLVRTADNLFTPGPTPPRLLTAEGVLVPFTPQTRVAHEQAEQTAGRTHALLMEWDRCISQLTDVQGDARLLLMAFLARRFAGVRKTAGTPRPVRLDEKRLHVLFDHLLAKADARAVQLAILRRTLDWIES